MHMLLLNIVLQATAGVVEPYWHSKISDGIRWVASIFLFISGIAHAPIRIHRRVAWFVQGKLCFAG